MKSLYLLSMTLLLTIGCSPSNSVKEGSVRNLFDLNARGGSPVLTPTPGGQMTEDQALRHLMSLDIREIIDHIISAPTASAGSIILLTNDAIDIVTATQCEPDTVAYLKQMYDDAQSVIGMIFFDPQATALLKLKMDKVEATINRCSGVSSLDCSTSAQGARLDRLAELDTEIPDAQAKAALNPDAADIQAYLQQLLDEQARLLDEVDQCD